MLNIQPSSIKIVLKVLENSYSDTRGQQVNCSSHNVACKINLFGNVKTRSALEV